MSWPIRIGNVLIYQNGTTQVVSAVPKAPTLPKGIDDYPSVGENAVPLISTAGNKSVESAVNAGAKKVVGAVTFWPKVIYNTSKKVWKIF